MRAGRLGNVDWVSFAKNLDRTHLTHLYISDKLVDAEAAMRLIGDRGNRRKDVRHLYEHDVIDSAIRLWFTPSSSDMYQVAV